MASVTVDPIIAEARKRWQRCADAEDAQRKAILLAKQFRALDQWPSAIKLAREGAGAITGQPPQPPRPCLVVDRLSQPVRQCSNTIKNADFGFDVMPNGGGSDRETAEILKGYLRRVQNEARSESPIEWAADGAIEGGLGWFRIRTKFVHENWEGGQNDPEAYDQELCLERLANNLSVYCDPSANKPTREDANYLFVVDDMDREVAKERFKLTDEDIRSLDDFQSTGDTMKGWVTKDTMRVAEYWRVEWKMREISSDDGKFKRTLRVPVVKGSLINAVKELEKFEWVGSRIPLVPILGEELNVDGKPVLRGIIALGMDAQRMVNYTYSGAVEIFALASKHAPRVPAAAVAQYKSIWDTRNVYNYSYLPYDQWDDEGRELRPPVDDTSEPPIQAAVELMRISEEAIKASTSTGDASLGNTNPNERSGRALEALQSQSELANSNYPDNVRRAMIYAAELMIEVIPKITRPGQILHIMGTDDEPEQVMVGRPFQKGPDGIPIAAPEGVTPEMAKQPDNLWKFYDPTRGRYATTVTIGKATATRAQEGSRALGELIPHLPPEMAAVATPEYVEQLSFPGAQKIAERLRKVLPPNLQPEAENGQPNPEMLAQQLQQAQMQMQQMQQLADDNAAKMEIEKLKQFAEHDREEKRIAADLEKARMDNATRIEVARIAAAKEISSIRVEAEEERLATGLEIGAAAVEADRQRAHDAAMAAAGHGMSTASQQAEHEHAAEMQAEQQNAAREAAETAAQQQREAQNASQE